MAVALGITDGTTTVSLSGTSPVLGCTYFPQTSQYRNGEWQDVTEQAEVNLRGTAATIRSTINSIETLLQAAIRRQETGVGDRVYVTFAPLSETAYRSEILDGRVVWSTEPGLRRLGDTNPTVQVAIIWTRAPGWDGAEAELSISANGQGAATGGRTVTNNPANGNWIQAAAAQVAGDMPAPVRIEMQNTAGSSRAYQKLYINVNAYSDPANLVHYLQGEAVLSGGASSADATCSGGNKWTVTVTTTATTYQWTLPAADMQRTKGRRARILARVTSSSGAVYVQPKILNSDGAQTLWIGDELYLGSLVSDATLFDFGIVPLPAGGYSASYAAHRLGLALRGGSIFVLDVLQLSMVDSFRFMDLNVSGVSTANNATIVHDGIEGLNYHVASSVRTPIATAFGGPITLEAATLQRIYFWEQLASGGGSPIADTFSVRVYHRPRRLTV